MINVCRVCGSEVLPWCKAVIMGKYPADYSRCCSCDFIQVDSAVWLSESYSSAITKTDIGLLSRNLWYSRKIVGLIRMFWGWGAHTCMDFGAGYGIMVRGLRDLGIDCRGYDAYCEQILSGPFVYNNLMGIRVDFITAIEVAEHMDNPHDLFGLLNTHSDTLIFTTELQPTDLGPSPKAWWYYCLEHGQHISLYSIKSLQVLAVKHGVYLYSNGHDFHVLTRKKIPRLAVRLAMMSVTAKFYSMLFNFEKKSLGPSDYQLVKNDMSIL